MDQDDIEEFMQGLQAEFLSGRLDALASRFKMPLVVYSIAGVTVLRTKEELMQRTEQYRAAMIAMSVVSSKVTVVSRDPPYNHRFRATVRITDYNADGRAVAGSLVRYFLVKTDGTYQIEMIEYLEAPLPPEEVERLVH